jgi:predicted O-methyltransferase YrrM
MGRQSAGRDLDRSPPVLSATVPPTPTVPPLDPAVRAAAEAARGFMPPEEGEALYGAASSLPPDVSGPLLEIGSYCGKSALYLGAAARTQGRVLFALDHHRGSEENQAGWEWHEPDLVDPAVGKMDTLPWFRRTVHDAGLEDTVVALVGDSPTVGRVWATPLAFLFIDGGHGTGPAHRDFATWTPLIRPGGLLAIHDVFPDPADGGRPPYEIYRRALDSGLFSEVSATGSLRVLRRG